ncbi:SDR family NAD(P)-dependent oxidoreductase [Sphingopyxis sp.]|uniref:SDR family NAD(P)-dependent oxidoreductase n=1 Tax=Sphingopyxis sp. TaxID=1908224 RepID=UPI002CF36521|nr:SDR family NAD(P)-dependent oxidoreductase [Sphingopyxis sp.]HET6525412.1 SDR family NAD(P)-dependent oxidoreductase [Sphingopyxis sp.]HMP43655.1 SDR family NAD(P)-dependent oxidoreductase [Sphingopyxis sp.]
MNRAIIVGASSGIGRELAMLLSRHGYSVGVTGRRCGLLADLAGNSSGSIIYEAFDVADTNAMQRGLAALIERLGGLDLLVISAGVGHINAHLGWEAERETIAVNVEGFAAAANIGMQHFLAQDTGHLVAISSIAGLRGGGDAPAYNASKAFVSNYMEGLRQNMARRGLPIATTDVRPGFVDTAMAKGDGLFWVASPEKVAKQIYSAIRARKSHIYVTKRWRLVAALMKFLPNVIYDRL